MTFQTKRPARGCEPGAEPTNRTSEEYRPAPEVATSHQFSFEAEAPTQVGIFEAEAHGAALRAAGHVAATARALEEAGHALDASGLTELARDLGKVAELHRLCMARLAAVVRRMGASS